MSCSGHILCPGSTPEGRTALSTLAGLALHSDTQHTHGTDLPCLNPLTCELMLDTAAQNFTSQHQTTQGLVCCATDESQQRAENLGTERAGQTGLLPQGVCHQVSRCSSRRALGMRGGGCSLYSGSRAEWGRFTCLAVKCR